MKKVLVFLLICVLLLAFVVFGESTSNNGKSNGSTDNQKPTNSVEDETQAQAEITSVEYQIQRQDHSFKNSQGKVVLEYYYDLVTVNGDSEAITAINAVFDSRYQEFLSSKDEMKDMAEFAEQSSEYEFKNVHNAEVTHNANHILCVKYTGSWYMGGVFDATSGALVFNTKTGKPATLTEVTGLDAATLEKQLKVNALKDITEKFGQELALSLSDYINNYEFDEIVFSIENNEIIWTFYLDEIIFDFVEVSTGIFIG